MASYVDAEFLLTKALRAALPGDVNVTIAQDTDTALGGRTVLVRAMSGVGPSNADPRWAGFWSVVVSCLSRGVEDAQELADLAFDAVLSLEESTVPGAGFVSSVDVSMLPVRSSPAVANTTVFAQFNFQITARLRPLAEEATHGA